MGHRDSEGGTGGGRGCEMKTLKHLSSNRCRFTSSARPREATSPAGVGLGVAGSSPTHRANRDVYRLHKQLDLV